MFCYFFIWFFCFLFIFFFFFQAEDGIRDRDVTGVQTCALPIYLGQSISADPYRLAALTDPDAETPRGTLHTIPEGAAAMVSATSGEYPVFVGWGMLADLGRRLCEAGVAGQVHII